MANHCINGRDNTCVQYALNTYLKTLNISPSIKVDSVILYDIVISMLVKPKVLTEIMKKINVLHILKILKIANNKELNQCQQHNNVNMSMFFTHTRNRKCIFAVETTTSRLDVHLPGQEQNVYTQIWIIPDTISYLHNWVVFTAIKTRMDVIKLILRRFMSQPAPIDASGNGNCYFSITFSALGLS